MLTRACALANCGCTFFPGCESLPQVIHRNDVKWWPYTQAVLIPSVPKPSAAQVFVAYGSTSHPPGPVAETRIRLDRRRPVLGAGLRSWLLSRGVVPVPRLSRGPRPHNEREARGVLAHMENVPPGAQTGALHRIPRTPLLLSYR